MEDPQIHGTIEALVAEEHELWRRESAGEASEPTANDFAPSGSRSVSAGTYVRDLHLSFTSGRCSRA